MCHSTQEPTVLSRMSCRPISWILTLFTSLACYTGAFRDRLGLSSPYHVATLEGSPVFLPCVSLEVLFTPTRRYHCRTFIRPSSPCVCHSVWKSCLHTRRFGTLAGPPPPVSRLALGTPISLAPCDPVHREMKVCWFCTYLILEVDFPALKFQWSGNFPRSSSEIGYLE